MALTLSSLYDNNNNNNNNINNNVNNNDDILLSLLNNLIDNNYDNDDIMINDIQNIINTLLSDEESISLSVILSQIRDQEDEEAQIALIEAENDKDDIVILISSSGKSKNILNAAKFLKRKKIKLITFSGFSEKNDLKKLGN
jgi:DNA-binding MurR/RpiR family transcriptional regulator